MVAGAGSDLAALSQKRLGWAHAAVAPHAQQPAYPIPLRVPHLPPPAAP